MSDLAPSEFEGTGVKRSGVFNSEHTDKMSAAEKLRIIRRTEQDPDSPVVDLDAPADRWKHGGIESIEDLTGP